MHHRHLFAFLFLLLFAGLSSAGAQEWEPIGPGNSMPSPVAVDTVNSILYGASGPELYKSVDRGHSWERVLFPEDSGEERNWNIIADLVCDGERLYVIRRAGPILATADQGRSWRTLKEVSLSPDGPSQPASLVPLRDTLYLIVAGSYVNSRPYFYSTDRGNSWKADTANFGLISFYASATTLYGRSRNRLYRLTSPGNWEPFGPDSIAIQRIFMWNDLLFPAAFNALYRVSESQGTWERIRYEGYLAIPNAVVLEGDTIFAYYPTGTEGTIYQTHVDGDSLVLQPERQLRTKGWAWLFNLQDELILIDRNSYQWNNITWKWDTIDVPNHWKNQGIGFMQLLSDGLYVRATSGMFVLRNEEIGWEQLEFPDGKLVLSIDTTAGKIYVTVATYPFVYSTSDGGITWDSTMFADSSHLTGFGFYVIDGTFYMTNGYHKKLFRSSDQGKTWEVIGDFHAYDGVFGSGDVLFYRQFNFLYRSFDGGSSWEPVSLKGLPVQNGEWAIRYEDGSLYFWGVDYQGYLPEDRQTGDTITGTIFRSDDNGETWVGLGASLPTSVFVSQEMRRVQFVKIKGDTIGLTLRDSTYYNKRLFVSLDRGDHWNELEIPELTEPYSVEFDGDDIYVGTLLYGVLHAKLDVGSSVPLPGSPPLSSTADLKFDRTGEFVEYRLPVSGHLRLALYSIDGREAATLVDADREAGTHRVQIGNLPLPPGVYLLVLQTGRQSVGRLIRVGPES